jgi:peptidylprolyl isomerase
VRRVAATLGTLCLALTVLTACGEDDGAEDSGAVTVTGGFGEQPEVEYDGRVVRNDTESEVLIEGSGAEVAEGDTVFLELYIGNGFDGEQGLTTFEVEAPAEEPTEEPTEEPSDEPTDKETKGSEKGDKKDGKADDKADDGADDDAKPATVNEPPFMLTLNSDQAFPGVRAALEGVKVGSRVQVLSTPEDAFGEFGNPALGIANQDTVVFVVDVVEKVLPAPEGTEKQLPEGLPSIVESDGVVSSLDFSGTGEPSNDLEVHTVVEGNGPAIKKSGSQVAMRYLGQVWKGATPFDENYSAAGPGFPNQNGGIDPATIPGQLIKGWNEGLVGVKAGSRVMLVVPSRYRYGKQGSGELIKAGDTLVFVIDVLGVA